MKIQVTGIGKAIADIDAALLALNTETVNTDAAKAALDTETINTDAAKAALKVARAGLVALLEPKLPPLSPVPPGSQDGR
jgi:hypothetical protein